MAMTAGTEDYGYRKVFLSHMAPLGAARQATWALTGELPTVHKVREQDRVVAIDRKVVLGSQEAVDRALEASVCSRTVSGRRLAGPKKKLRS